MLYFAGVGQQQKVKAQYKLSDGPILVLVDDFGELLLWPETRDMLADRIAGELLGHKATKEVIADDALRRFRQARPDFDKLTCNRIGEMIGADQVLWVEVTDFFASEAVEDTSAAARMAVTVKVVNPKGTRKDRTVRLWPQEPDGSPVKAELNANEVSRARQRPAIANLLTSRLAEEIGRLFYDHTLDDLARS